MNNKPVSSRDFFNVFLVLCLMLGLFAPTIEVSASSGTPNTTVQTGGVTTNSFSTPAPPVLVIYNDTYTSNKFGRFLGEIMKAEGFNLFDSDQLANVTATILARYDTVVLAETTLTVTQSTMFSQYVQNGGNLIAMRPDSQLATVFGLGTSAGTLNNAYVAIQTGTTYGQGFPAESLQTHSPASQYSGTTAQTVATLYSNASTATSYPAVTVNNFGSGKAVAYTYDLARTVAYIRQGNPAQLDVDADGDGVTRVVDMYYNWIDLTKMPVPQADIHQRFFARLLSQLNTSKKPLPRFWYFPNAKKTALVLTSDAHGNPDSYYANMINSMANYTATTTFYMAQAGQPLPTNVSNWENQGFTFSTHPYKVDNPLSVGYDDVDAWYDNSYGTRTSQTVRVHRLQWQGWVDAAKIGVAHGYMMDFSPYRYGLWLKNPDNSWVRGYMTGSGLPMKFIDENGQIVENFGQYTEIADDQMLYAGPENLSDASALFYTKQSIDASEAGNYQSIAFQMHVDYYSGEQTWAENTLAYARSLNLPIYNGDTWLNYTNNRYNSGLSAFGWSNNHLTFTASIPATQSGQTVMVPLRSATGDLSGITVNGSNASYTTQIIRGETFAFLVLPGGNSSINATYVPDTTPPTISNISVSATPTQAQISWTTNELATSTVNYGATAAMGSSASTSGYTTNHTVTINSLVAGNTYYYQIASADQSGNNTNATQATFTTPGGLLVQNTYNQFAGGSFTNTAATAYGQGQVKLLSSLEDTFNGSSLNTTNWNSGTWVTGGAQSVSGGNLNVGGAYVTSNASFSLANLSIEAQVKFTQGVANQHFGPSPDLNSNWFIFSVPGFDTNNLYARTNFGSTQINTLLPGVDLSQSHDLQIKFSGGQVLYYVDGAVAATHTVAVSGSMPIWYSSSSTSGPIVSDWVRVNSYPASGTFVSTPMDAGNAVIWSSLSWQGTLNGGTIQFETRSSGDATNWSAWSSASSNASFPITSPIGRYLQYRATLTTPDSTTSPQLSQVSVGYNLAQVNSIQITPTSASVGLGQGFQFAATGYDTANNPLPGLVTSWTVVNGGGTIDANGIFTGTVKGTFPNTVVASAGGKSGTASVLVGNAAPTISSITPNTIVNTSSNTLTINGANFTDPVSVQLGTQTLTGVTFVNSNQLTVVVPAGFAAGVYNLKVTNPDTLFVTATNAVTVRLPAPTLTSLSPTSGTTSVNISISLTGSNFVSGATVKLGTTTLSSINFVSATNLTAVVLAGTAQGSYDITVTNPDGQSVTLLAAYTVAPPAPPSTITKIVPEMVSNTSANTITVSGVSFIAPVTVALSGVNQSGVTIVNDTTLTFNLAAGFATGTYDVTVTNGTGQSTTITGGLVVLPQAIVQTSQANFAAGTLTNTSAVNQTGGEIKLTTGIEDYFENGSLDGNQWVTGTWAPGGSAAVANGKLGVSAGYARSANLQPITRLQGRVKFVSGVAYQHFGFSEDLSTSWILFSIPSYNTSQVFARTNINGVYAETPLNITMDTYHDFLLVVGGGTVQYYVDGVLLVTNNVTVNATTYVWLSSGSSAITLQADNVVAGTYPASGTYLSTPMDAGQTLSWNGLHWLVNNNGGTASIQARTSTDGTNWSSWSTPATTAGLVSLSLPQGRYLQYQLNLATADSSKSPEVTAVAGLYGSYVPGPVARIDVTPTSATLLPGATQQFTATGYDSNNFLLTGLAITWSTTGGGTVNSSGLYTAGNTPGTYPNSVVASSGSVNSAASITVNAFAPTVTSVTPNAAPSNVLTTITINGANFVATPTVTLGTTALTNVTFVSATQLTATVPTGLATGAYSLTVTNPDTQVGTLANAYTVQAPLPAPTLSTITPTSGANNVTNTITINGANFVATPTVTLGTTALSGVTFVNATQLTAVVPAGMAVGVYALTVTNPNGQNVTLNNAFTVRLPAPTITSVSPVSADNVLTRTLTINGTGYTGTPVVKLGTTTLTGVQLVSATQLTAKVAQNFTPGLYSVTVTNPDGQNVTLNNAFTVTTAPTVTQNTSTTLGAGTFSSTTLTLSGTSPTVNLLPTFNDGFTTTSVNTGNWTASTITNGGNVTVSGGLVSVRGSSLASVNSYTQSVVEGYVKFSSAAGANQNFGFASSLTGLFPRWAMFGVTTGNPTRVSARTTNGFTSTDTPITGINFDTFYNLRIEVGASQVTYYLNGTLVATHNFSNLLTMRIYLSSSSNNGNTMQADWIRLNNFAATGTFTSSTIDLGSTASAWTTISWAATVPTGAGISVRTQTSNDGVNWSALSTATSTSGSAITSPLGRYIRYQVTFTRGTNTVVTPNLTSVTIGYSTQP